MRLTTHTNASDFLAQAQAALSRDEVIHNLILGIASRLRAAPETAQTPPYLATVADDNGLVFAALMTPPFPLTIAGPAIDAPGLDEALSLVGDDLRSHGWPVTAVSGRAPLSERFAAAWCSQTGGRYRVQMRERIYELRQVMPLLSPPPGRFCAATPADADTVEQWVGQFMQRRCLNRTRRMPATPPATRSTRATCSSGRMAAS